MIAYLAHIAVISFFWGVLLITVLAMKRTIEGN
jgi:hypothetical protein